MRHLIFQLVLISVTCSVYGQHERCGTVEYNRRMQTMYPEFKQASEQIEQYIAQYQEGGETSRALITIPVVFHVLYKVNMNNISDAQVLSQLDVLNEDFRKLNQNFETNTPAVFKPLGVDTEIEFCLAKTDPQGNPTTGITRKQTTVSPFSIDKNDMKFDSTGGTNAWPRDRYLNIWICELESPLLGYAQFPGGLAATDGVVLHYRVVGRAPANPYQTAHNQGRTATHEVGHWLQLYHIWGSEESGCEDSDQVEDTPNQDKANFGCPSFPSITCGNSPNGDMYMNFMDYTDDICHTMFTPGQKHRMRALFGVGGARASLIASTVCYTGVEPVSDCADTLRYPFTGTYTLYEVSSSGAGYVAGTSSLNDKAKAEFFSASGVGRQLKGAWFDFAVAKQGSAPAGTQVQFKAWSNTGTGQTPGQVVGTAAVPLSQIIADVANSRSTEVMFEQPVEFGNGFYIGFELPVSPGYELALYTNENGQSTPGTAWEKTNSGQWLPYSAANSWGLEVAHAVFPFIEVPDLLSKFSVTDSSICKGQTVQFRALDKANYYHWEFEGGNITAADTAVVNVQYSNTGGYSVELHVASHCFSDTIKKSFAQFITVNPNPPIPFLEFDGVKLVSTVTNGQFKWYRNNNVIAGAEQSFYVPQQNGIYRVTVTQSGCSSTSAPFDIEGVGIASVGSERQFIYPNPTSGQVYLSGLKNEDCVISILDAGGKQVYIKELEGVKEQEEHFFDLGFLESGVYFVRLSTKSMQVHQRLVLIR